MILSHDHEYPEVNVFLCLRFEVHLTQVKCGLSVLLASLSLSCLTNNRLFYRFYFAIEKRQEE